jgi:hypothetical protein
MRVTFPRFPDYQRSYSLVERDNGVVCRLPGEIAGPRLPRAIMQLVVERELRVTDGIWAAIAAGTVAVGNARAQALTDVVAAVAALDAPTPAQIRRLAIARLPLPDAGISPALLAAAAQALQVEAARWAHLRPGGHLSYQWPTEVRYRPAS